MFNEQDRQQQLNKVYWNIVDDMMLEFDDD